jgi:hypothetical protein
MAKKKAIKKTVENKAEKVVVENKAVAKAPAKYSGYISMGGAVIRMAEPKARLLVKQGRAKFA